MTDVPHPFAPFSPSPPIAPEQPKAEKSAKEKKPRKAKEPAVESEKIHAMTPQAVAPRARKPRSANKPKGVIKAHSPKFDLQTTLAAAQLLNESDFPMFEKMVVMLDEAGKPQRDRVMSALAKVFA